MDIGDSQTCDTVCSDVANTLLFGQLEKRMVLFPL